MYFFQGELISIVINCMNDRDCCLSTRRSYCPHVVLRKYVQNECSCAFVARNRVTTYLTHKCHEVWQPKHSIRNDTQLQRLKLINVIKQRMRARIRIMLKKMYSIIVHLFNSVATVHIGTDYEVHFIK